MAIRIQPAPAASLAPIAGTEGPTEQALPVDIYSMIDEIRRSISELRGRTADIPDIYTQYLPPGAQAPIVGTSGMMEAALPMEVRPRPVIRMEQTESISTDKLSDDDDRALPAKPAHDIRQASTMLRRFREDYAGLARDLTEVEQLIGEAIRASAFDRPIVIPVPNASALAMPREVIPVQEGRPAPEAVVIEKARVAGAEAGSEIAGVERRPETSAKAPAKAQGTSMEAGHAKLARGLVQGISLSNVIRNSTVEMMVLQAAIAAEVPAGAAVQALSMTEYGQYVPAPAVMAESHGMALPESAPDKAAQRPAISVSPVAQAVDVARIFDGLISSYLNIRGTPSRRGAMQDGVTQLLLSLPGQQAMEGHESGLFDVIAGLQASRPKALEMPAPAQTPTTTSTPASPDDEPMQSTILGDLREIRGTMGALQDAVGGLRMAGLPSQEAPGATEVTGVIRPEYEGMAGEFSSIQASIARLQAAMDYLRVNVPTLADFVMLQRAFAGVRPGSAAAVPEAVSPVAIAIEGVQPKSAPISLPDFSWVTREFGQMQGMIARLQVPMYAEGGLVQQPTLAFVGESEPEWIVPMSAWDASQTKLNEFYSMLWSQIQDLGASMKETVGGVNEALEGVQAGGKEESEDSDIGQQLQDTMKDLVDKYLGMVGLSVDTLKDVEKTAGMGVVLGTATVALPFAKKIMMGEDEEEKEEASGGEKDDAEDEDDEEDFWELIDDLDDAESINDKRDGKFDPDEE
jgi:hypothetical protein